VTDRRILLVEDHLYIRRVLTDQLSCACYDVTATASAEEALPCFAALPIDLVLTDLHLAGLSGFALAALLRRAGGRGATVPIFGMTAGCLAEDEARCVAVGITALIVKPLSIARFRAMADQHLAELRV
jgi:two-component system capsular synthesis sensor histidine kinase RcsC